ncbi:MAG: hypothetical protein KDK34_07260, partial [Leptospiraceae bacterium]|nr:hypothetical protein [Leptospiraceae bacterium]
NYLFTWKAPSADKKYWGSLTLEVRARVPGIEDEVTLTQGFYSSPIAPARFTGNASERLEKGSLLIDVELDVERECRYSLHANLYSVIDDQPTHWASVDEILKPGRQVVSFKFFGKVFHDGGYEGKFQLRDLRGTCENLPFPASWIGDPTKIKAIEQAPPVDEPLLLYVPYTDFTYTTRSYRLSDFSEDEWSSDEKNRRLDRLQNLANMPAQ